MKIIIPMAGRGSRLRPHTLTVPKPLIPIAGKPIVQRLVEDIAKVCDDPIDEVAFIIGDFGEEVEDDLKNIASKLNAKASIYRQEEPLGTAHAIHCAKESLDGPVVVAFADTLFKADFKLNKETDGVIWVKKVDNPSAFGVIKVDHEDTIIDFVEKPKKFVSDLAIVGIYFFKEGKTLFKELDYLIEKNITGGGGEYQLTAALENMRAKGAKFKLTSVDHWMDCGNKNVTVQTNSKVLEFEKDNLDYSNGKIINSLIIKPCYIGEGVIIENSKIGPNVSVGKDTVILNSNIDNCLIQDDTRIHHANLTNSMIGNHAKYKGVIRNISLGDYSSFDLVD